MHLDNYANMKEISQANFSTILKHISSLQQQSLLRKFCQTSRKSESMFLCGTFWKKTFDEAVHIDKSQVPFNALTKKGQLITVCLRATCKDINQISLENMSKEECSPPNLNWQEHQIYKLRKELWTKFWEIT